MKTQQNYNVKLRIWKSLGKSTFFRKKTGFAVCICVLLTHPLRKQRIWEIRKAIKKKHLRIFTLYLRLFKCQVTMSWKGLNLILVRPRNHIDLKRDIQPFSRTNGEISQLGKIQFLIYVRLTWIYFEKKKTVQFIYRVYFVNGTDLKKKHTWKT